MSVVKNPFQVSRDQEVALFLWPCHLFLFLQPVWLPTLCFAPFLSVFTRGFWNKACYPLLMSKWVEGTEGTELGGDRGVKKPDGCLAPGHSSEPRSQAHEPQEVGSAGAPAPSSDRQSILMLTSEAQPDLGNFEGLLDLNSCQAASALPPSPHPTLFQREVIWPTKG